MDEDQIRAALTAVAEIRARVEMIADAAGPWTPNMLLPARYSDATLDQQQQTVEWSEVGDFTTWSNTLTAAEFLPSDAAALPDTEQRAPEPARPADTVIDILRSQPLSKPDRQRIGRELESANERADGNKAGTGEAFGRITGSVPSGMATLTGRT